ALLAGSPAIDAGDGQFLTAPFQTPDVTTDQRGLGVARIADGLVTGTAIVDIGAYESQPAVAGLSDQTTFEDTQVHFDFSVSADTQNVVATSSDQSVARNVDLVVTGSGGTRTLTIQPTPDGSGTATITVTVSKTVSGTTTSSSSTFQLTVTAVNDAP